MSVFERWHPRIRVVVGKGRLAFQSKDRAFTTRADVYLDGPRIAALGEPPADGRRTEMLDALDGRPQTRDILAKLIAHGIAQVLRRRLGLKPILEIAFEDGTASPERRTYWVEAATLAKAQRVEFAPAHPYAVRL